MNHLSDTTLNTVSVPDDFYKIFLNAQNYVKNYFFTMQQDRFILLTQVGPL